jgi:hypothetical protein
LLPAPFKAVHETFSGAVDAATGLLDAPAPSWTAKAASFLHVNEHVEPNAARRSCLLSISDLLRFTMFSSLVFKLMRLPTEWNCPHSRWDCEGNPKEKTQDNRLDETLAVPSGLFGHEGIRKQPEP